MNQISNWLQSNPLVVLLMFVISLASGIATLVLGWKQLYSDYLSKPVTVPVWLILVVIPIIFAYPALFPRKTSDNSARELIKVEGKRFGVQRIILDGKSFERCEFNGSEVVFEGSDAFALEGCHFIGPRVTFARNAALTFSVLHGFYKDPAFRPFVEQVFANIRSGDFPQGTPPSVVPGIQSTEK